ncbi:hypothetical protein [Cupriavidus laharis]|nr:hypothetical protein [Cupriavidus laharis]
MWRQKRIPNGRPMDGTDVVAVDVIALLSGVNFGSVIKIIAAIEAMCIHLNKQPEEVVRFKNASMEPVEFDGHHEARIAATDDMIHEIVRNPRISLRRERPL